MPPITRGKRLRRRDQTAAPLVKKRRYRGKPLPDGFNIDHHHNIWYATRVVNPYFTLS
jgi:sugar lactone lactonase YvrE